MHHSSQSEFYLACGHEEREDEDEGALGHWQPVTLLQGEEDGAVQAGLGRAVENNGRPSVKHTTAAEVQLLRFNCVFMLI